MRLRPFAVTCLLTLSTEPYSAFGRPMNIPEVTREAVGAASGIPAAPATSPFEHECHAPNDQLQILTAITPSGGHPGGAAHYRGAAEPDGADLHERFARPRPPKNSWSKDAMHFEMPRYPPKDEWAFKTWWIEKWRPISRKLGSGISTFFSVFFLPFKFLKAQELKYRPIPLHGLPRLSTPVWEKLPSGVKETRGRMMADSLISRVKNRIGINPKKEVSQRDIDDETMPIFQEHVETPKLSRESKWKIPDLPSPPPSDVELLKQSYLLGGLYKEFKNTPPLQEHIDLFMKAVINAKTGVKARSANDLEKLKLLLGSEEHLKLLEEFYDKRYELMALHQEMQVILNEVVKVLDGEANTRTVFQKIIRYHNTKISSKMYEGSSPVTQIPNIHSNFLRIKYPQSDKMHLSPLVLLDDIKRDAGPNFHQVIQVDRYQDSKPISEKLTKYTGKITNYVDLSHKVEQIEKKLKEVREFASSLTEADFENWFNKQNVFFEIVSLKDVYGTSGIEK